MKIDKYEQVWDIWNKSKVKLYNYSLARFKDKKLAEEVTQEVVLKLYKSCCSDKEINNLNSWLYQITHNVSLDILKREAKQRDIKPIDNHQNDTDSISEITNFLSQILDFLPEKYAKPLKLSDLDNIPQKEIAKILA